MNVRHALLATMLFGSVLELLDRRRAAAGSATASRTLAEVESSGLFTGLGFALDSSLTTAGVRTYRPAAGMWRKRATLRLRASETGQVSAISLGFPLTEVKRGFQLRVALAEFVSAMVPRDDSLSASPFIAQLEHNLGGAADSGFLFRPETDTLLPKLPSPAYLAMLGLRKAATEQFGASRVSVSRLVDGKDTAVVMSLLLDGNSVAPGTLSDWIDARRYDLLGATQADLEGSDLVTGLELTLSSKTSSLLTYGAKSIPNALRVSLDSASRASRLALLLPDMGSRVSVSSRVTNLVTVLRTLIPQQDSVAMAQVVRSALLETDGPGARDAARISAFVAGTATTALLNFTASSVRISRTGSGRNAMFVLAVGRPGSFTPAAARASTRSRRSSSP